MDHGCERVRLAEGSGPGSVGAGGVHPAGRVHVCVARVARSHPPAAPDGSGPRREEEAGQEGEEGEGARGGDAPPPHGSLH